MRTTLPRETHLISKGRIDKHGEDLDCDDLKIVRILHQANSEGNDFVLQHVSIEWQHPQRNQRGLAYEGAKALKHCHVNHFNALYPEQLRKDRHNVSCEQRIYSLHLCEEYFGKFSDARYEITCQILDRIQKLRSTESPQQVQ
jgi:hypothetical protein